MKNKKEQSPLSKIMQKNYPGLHFHRCDLKTAGKRLSKDGEQGVIDYLKDKGSVEKSNFKPPAKARIIEVSRPFSEWSIFKANQSIQQFVFNMTESEMINNRPTGKLGDLCQTDIENWILSSKIDLHGYWSVQGLRAIISNAFNTYDGVIKKAENKKLKTIKKIYGSDSKLPVPFIAESLFDINNKLIHSPGVNNSIHCYQSIKIVPNQPNTSFISDFIDRCNIPNGARGYIPEWQRNGLNKKISFRHRKWYSHQNLKPKINRTSNKYSIEMIEDFKRKEALLCKMTVGDDWLLFDARGLLRNLQWRKLVSRKDCTIEDILKNFTDSPVINPDKHVITFSYKEGVIPVASKKITHYKKAPDLLKKLSSNEDVCLVSIDLGQNSFVSAKYSLVKNINGELKPQRSERHFISDNSCSDVDFYNKLTNNGKNKACELYREKSDALQNKIYEDACKSLSAEMQEEIEKVNKENNSTLILERIKKSLNIETSSLLLDEMSGNSCYIANSYLNTDAGKLNQNEVFRTYKEKGSNKESKSKKSDFSFYQDYKSKLSKETNDALQKAKWELQINSEEYKKLSILKKEWARQVCNWVIRKGKEISNCKNIVINIEDLNISNKIMSGSGKREIGWNNFGKYKKENRWFIQVLHKVFSDLANDKGINVIECCPARTSITCTKCGYCDKNNRKGVNFKCMSCDFKADADLDIATDNLQKVALTGTAMFKPKKI